MAMDPGNPATLEPIEFSRFVKRAPADLLQELMRGPRRTDVLDEVFRRMPAVFRPDRAADLTARVHYVIGDRQDGGTDRYELVIADRVCTVSATPSGPPRLTLTLGGADFLRLVTGNAHPVVLVMKGRLRTSGDKILTARFPSLFDPPKP